MSESPKPDPDEKWVNRLGVILFVVFLALVVAAGIGHAAYVYGDWRCAIANCVRVVR